MILEVNSAKAASFKAPFFSLKSEFGNCES